MNLIKKIVVVASVMTLTACSGFGLKNEPVEHFPEMTVSTDDMALIESVDWGYEEWLKYKQASGYKAYAIAVDRRGELWSSGWSEDMVSREWAEKAAMYLCLYFSGDDYPCKVVDIQGRNLPNWYNSQLKAGLPDEIISFESALAYKKYTAATGPKAAAMRVPSGILSWRQGSSVAEAKQKALKACKLDLHEAESHCVLLTD